MLVFAVETSCDETSVCILNKDKKIKSHIIFSQEEHGKFGGVIPELASRAHLQILQKISKNALVEADIDISDIEIIHTIANRMEWKGIWVFFNLAYME